MSIDVTLTRDIPYGVSIENVTDFDEIVFCDTFSFLL